MSRIRSAALVAAIALSSATRAVAQPPGGMGRGGGMMGMGRDSATMALMQVVHELVMNHDRITRTVTNLPDGIRTVTESDDPRLARLIREHVVTSGQRVARGDDPGLPMESPALREIFRNGAKIHATTEPTAKGIVVVETSDDSATVVSLQTHAAEVTELVRGGMAALHESMMRNGGMMRGMGGAMMPGMRGGAATGTGGMSRDTSGPAAMAPADSTRPGTRRP